MISCSSGVHPAGEAPQRHSGVSEHQRAEPAAAAVSAAAADNAGREHRSHLWTGGKSEPAANTSKLEALLSHLSVWSHQWHFHWFTAIQQMFSSCIEGGWLQNLKWESHIGYKLLWNRLPVSPIKPAKLSHSETFLFSFSLKSASELNFEGCVWLHCCFVDQHLWCYVMVSQGDYHGTF